MPTYNRTLASIFVFSLLAMATQAQATCEERPLENHSLARCKAWPAVRDLAISAKSTFTADPVGGDDVGTFDLELSVVDSTNDRTLATYRKAEAYNTDAISFSDLVIDTARYNLAPDLRAFGIRSAYEHSSSVNPYSKTDLALYLKEGNTLRPVLEGLVVAKNSGEWGNCTGQGSDIHRTVDIGKSSHNGFADLIVTTSTTVMKSFKSGEECDDKTTDLKKTHITLSYDGRQYVIPEELKGY